jgi:hypothetical protein
MVKEIWVDVQVLQSQGPYKVASMDKEGVLRLHGKYTNQLDSQEVALLSLLIKRQQPRIEDRGWPEELAKRVSVYTHAHGHTILQAPPYYGMKCDASVWESIDHNPGTLFSCGSRNGFNLYGGLTDDACEFVLVAGDMMEMCYQEVIVRLAVSEGMAWEDDGDVYRLAWYIEAEELNHNPPEALSEIVVLANSAVKQVNYWRGLAGDYHIRYNTDPHDVRAR